MILFSAIVVVGLTLLRFWASDWMSAVLPTPMGGMTVDTLGIALAVMAAILADQLFRYFYWNRIFRRRKGRKAPSLVRDLVTFLFLAAGLSTGLYLEIGVSASGIAATSGAAAVVLGFALQTTIQDLFGGLSVNLDRSYAIGDWLTIHSQEFQTPVYGCVEGITWRTTCLRLQDGRRLIIPNRLVTSNPLTNHSRPPGPKRLSVELALDLSAPPERVADIFTGEVFKAIQAPGFYRESMPAVLVSRIDEDTIFYAVQFYIDPNKIDVDVAESVVLRALQDAIRKTPLPTPAQDVLLAQAPPAMVTDVAEETLIAIGRVPLFDRSLDAGQQAELAARCRRLSLPAGDTLIRQGDAGGSMFVILDGAARVTVTGTDGADQHVNVLALGDIVGEMSLLTGTARTATVRAATPLRVLEITKEAIEGLLPAAPELLGLFSQILAARQVQLTEASNRPARTEAVELDLLSKMRAFFMRSFGTVE